MKISALIKNLRNSVIGYFSNSIGGLSINKVKFFYRDSSRSNSSTITLSDDDDVDCYYFANGKTVYSGDGYYFIVNLNLNRTKDTIIYMTLYDSANNYRFIKLIISGNRTETFTIDNEFSSGTQSKVVPIKITIPADSSKEITYIKSETTSWPWPD